MTWYLSSLARYEAERSLIERLVAEVPWITPLGWRTDNNLRLIWEGDILVGAGAYPIRLQYPNHFPYAPPSVFPRDTDERWSSHQYGAGGELCLEFGPDNWEHTYSGADLIRSAHKLLSTERGDAPAEVASRHRTSLGQNLRSRRIRFLSTLELVRKVEQFEEGARGSATLTVRIHDESYVIVLRSLEVPDGQVWRDAGVPEQLGHNAYSPKGCFFALSKTAELPPTTTRRDFEAALRDAGCSLDGEDVDYVLLSRGSEVNLYVSGGSPEDVVIKAAIVPPEPDVVRTPHVDALAQKKVGIVGCGSLGSKVATSLARAGVGAFLLIDDDVLLPGNLSRHDLDWRDVAAHKGDALSRKIALVNSRAVCQVRRVRLGGQEASGSADELITLLSACDVLLDMTAEPRVFATLGTVAELKIKPFVWAQVFAGGIGGLVARYCPCLTPSPNRMRLAIDDKCREYGADGMPQAVGDGYDALREGVPLIASDADVSAIASYVSQVVLDTLTNNISLFPHAAYLIGLKPEWIFLEPFDTRPIDIPYDPTEDMPSTSVSDERAVELGTEILKMWNETVRGNPGSS